LLRNRNAPFRVLWLLHVSPWRQAFVAHFIAHFIAHFVDRVVVPNASDLLELDREPAMKCEMKCEMKCARVRSLFLLRCPIKPGFVCGWRIGKPHGPVGVHQSAERRPSLEISGNFQSEPMSHLAR
jgi:hypothetical protein